MPGKNDVMEQLEKTHEEIRSNFAKFQERDKEQEERIKKAGERSQELQNNLDKANSDIENLRKEQNDLLKRLEETEVRIQRPNVAGASISGDIRSQKPDFYYNTFKKMVRANTFECLNDEEAKAMYGDWNFRSMSEDIDSQGGYLAPVAMENELIKEAYDSAAIGAVSDTKSVVTKASEIPTIGKPTVGWINEEEGLNLTDAKTGMVRVRIYKIGAIVKVSNELLEDSGINLFSELSQIFGEAIGEKEDDAFAIGIGDNQPGGIFSNTKVKANLVKSGVAAALFDGSNNGTDALIKLLYKPKAKYRRNGKWAMNSTTESVVRTLKDENGQYLWQPSLQADRPPLLLGKPVINPEGAPDIAANAFPIVFGDFKGYKVRRRRGITVQLLNELYAANDQKGFKVTSRVGGEVGQAEAFAALKIAA